MIGGLGDLGALTSSLAASLLFVEHCDAGAARARLTAAPRPGLIVIDSVPPPERTAIVAAALRAKIPCAHVDRRGRHLTGDEREQILITIRPESDPALAVTAIRAVLASRLAVN